LERIPKSVKRFSEKMRRAEQKLKYIDLVYSDRCISTVGAISKRLSSEPPILFSKQRQALWQTGNALAISGRGEWQPADRKK
jgi:hypothetical protein